MNVSVETKDFYQQLKLLLAQNDRKLKDMQTHLEQTTVVARGAVVAEAGAGAPILIVDDDAAQQAMTEQTLRRLPLTAPLKTLSSGAELIAYLEGIGPYSDRLGCPYPSLVLLDMQMPEMDGFVVLEWLRSQPKYAGLPVVALSATGGLSDVNRDYGLGVRSYLTKPVDLKDFQSVARTLRLSA